MIDWLHNFPPGTSLRDIDPDPRPDPNDEPARCACQRCQGKRWTPVRCLHCNGSGEGRADGSRCIVCKGHGEIAVACPECNADAPDDDEPEQLRCRQCGKRWDEPRLSPDGVCALCQEDLDER